MKPEISQLFSLDGKVALVTGATHGIGFGIACALGEAGALICFNGRYAEKNEKALKAYQSRGIDAHGFVCDVTDEVQVQQMIQEITERFGSVDILVNNAGII